MGIRPHTVEKHGGLSPCEDQGYAIAVFLEPSQPQRSLPAIGRIHPDAAEPGLNKAVIIDGVMVLGSVPWTVDWRAGVQIKHAKGTDQVGWRQPLVLIEGVSSRNPRFM